MTVEQLKKDFAKLVLLLYPLGIKTSNDTCNLPLPPFVNKLLREANEIHNPNNDDTPTKYGAKNNPRNPKKIASNYPCSSCIYN